MTIITPLPAHEDAWNRAIRTFAQGLLVDVAATVVAVLVAYMSSGVEWTTEYWYALGGLLIKTVVTSVISYAARKVTPPPTG